MEQFVKKLKYCIQKKKEKNTAASNHQNSEVNGLTLELKSKIPINRTQSIEPQYSSIKVHQQTFPPAWTQQGFFKELLL